MQGRSSRVLSYVVDLCGLEPWQDGKLRAITWVLSEKNPSRSDDIVQEVALTAWVGQLTGCPATIGTLIAAANRAVADGRRA